jgi:hypothetical protein
MVDRLKPYICQSRVRLHGVLIPKGELKNLCLKLVKKIDSLRDNGNPIFAPNYVPLLEGV